MRRLLLLAAAVVAAGIFAGGLALVLSAGGDDDGATLAPRASMSVAAAEVRPPVHAFGEPVVAEVVLVADQALVRPDSIRIAADFTPYERAGPVRVERTTAGSSLRIRFSYPLRCLREGCAPDGPRGSFEFPISNVVYRFHSSPGPASAVIDWPRFEVTARSSSEAVAPQAWRANLGALPEVTYRWSPGPLAAALLAGSFGFGVLGVGIAWLLVRRPGPAGPLVDDAEALALTPLDRALELARDAARNGDPPDRRKALERVARELSARGLAELATRARALAWSSGAANPAAVDDLARDVGAAANGGRV
jgi:hypothetical protein